MSKPPAGVERLDPRSVEVAALLREIEVAAPPPVTRVFSKQGRRKVATLDGVCELGDVEFLHVPWLREPRRATSQVVWLSAAVVAALATGGSLLMFGRLKLAAIAAASSFTAIVGAGYNQRIRDSRRPAHPDGGGGLPGFICSADRLLIRYPDALYQIPRDRLRAITKHARGSVQGEHAMTEYDMTAELDGGGPTPIAVTIAEVVDLRGHEDPSDISERMAILLAVVSWLDGWL